MYFEYRKMLDLKNEVEFTLHEKAGGEYNTDTGKWIDEVETPIPVHGVIISPTEKELQYYDAGTYTPEDLKIYTQKEIANGEKISFNGQSYEVQRKKFNANFADFGTYMAKKVIK